MADFKEIADRVMCINEEKGWNTPLYPRGSAERVLQDATEIALIMTEGAEAIEEVRGGESDLYFSGGSEWEGGEPALDPWEPLDADGRPRKPEGARSELADIVIRAMHVAKRRGWDLEADIALKLDFNETRPARHGGKLA